ncbi:MAG TPA: sodium:proton antiporter [Candidatus Dormibacteraeota bacterium]|nr:sodium:proton antiporter [Candidatus Dormibacteraeota bacterium]
MIETRIAALVVILLIAAAIAVVARRAAVPYETALAIVGLGVGLIIGSRPIHLTSSLILFVLLPGLLFESSFNIRWRHVRDNLAAIVGLSTVGVLLTTAVVGFLGSLSLQLALPVAILFGALVSPTDPVAVTAVFRRIGVPSRLIDLVESEALLNDGTGAIVFAIALAATQGGQLAPGPAVLTFLQLGLGGCALGVAVGLLLSLVTSRLDDPQVEITLTGIAAYGGYLVADYLHVSPILCVVCAGFVLGNVGRPKGMSERTQAAVDVFWDYVSFLLNTAVFVLIGLDVPWEAIIRVWPLVLAAAGILLVARALAVYPLLIVLRPLGRRINLRWQHLMVWSGLRGAVALALLLSLQTSGPGAYQSLRGLVYGVVLISIIVQGLTMGPVARVLLPHRPGHPHT